MSGHEVAEVVDDLAVLVDRDPADTRRCALADVPQQARPAGLLGSPVDAVRTRTHRKDAEQQVEGFADGPGMRVGAEVPDAFSFRTAHHHGTRDVIGHRHREVGVALVVAVLHVEPRVELLDPVVFELECFDLGSDDGPVDATCAAHHRLGARVQRSDVGEVGVQPRTQVLRFADVDDPILRIAKPIDARRFGNRARRGPITRGVYHGVQPTEGADGTLRAATCGRAAITPVLQPTSGDVESPAGWLPVGRPTSAGGTPRCGCLHRRRSAQACLLRLRAHRPTRPQDPCQ